jgi:hypothetical protein
MLAVRLAERLFLISRKRPRNGGPDTSSKPVKKGKQASCTSGELPAGKTKKLDSGKKAGAHEGKDAPSKKELKARSYLIEVGEPLNDVLFAQAKKLELKIKQKPSYALVHVSAFVARSLSAHDRCQLKMTV